MSPKYVPLFVIKDTKYVHIRLYVRRNVAKLYLYSHLLMCLKVCRISTVECGCLSEFCIQCGCEWLNLGTSRDIIIILYLREPCQLTWYDVKRAE